MTANGGLNKGLTNTSKQMWAITTSVEIPMNTMKESGATLVDRPTQQFYIWIFIC